MTLFLVIAALASARVIRLVIDDTIFDGPRDWVLPRLPKHVHKLVTCPYCVSAYITAAAVGWYWAAHTLAMPFLAWMAVWWGAVFGYWLVELIAKENEPDTPDVINNFWEARQKQSEELPPRPPLPKQKRGT